MMPKEKKGRMKEYDPKVVIKGMFEDVIQVSVKPKAKLAPVKKAAKGKK
jgi:hypothetical protein